MKTTYRPTRTACRQIFRHNKYQKNAGDILYVCFGKKEYLNEETFIKEASQWVRDCIGSGDAMGWVRETLRKAYYGIKKVYKVTTPEESLEDEETREDETFEEEIENSEDLERGQSFEEESEEKFDESAAEEIKEPERKRNYTVYVFVKPTRTYSLSELIIKSFLNSFFF